MRAALVFAIIILTNVVVIGQDFSLKVKLSHENAAKARSITKNHEVVALAKRYQSEGLRPSYPGFKNPELALYFDFQGRGDARKAIRELSDMKLFQDIVEEEPAYALSCSNPHPALNDAWLVQNPSYALELINARCAWSITRGNPSILIGVADTEFEITHQDLIDQIASINGPVSANHPHGTQVAGVAGAEANNGIGVAGIGYNSQVAAHRVHHTIGADGRVSGFPPRAAIVALYNSGVPIINVSWSGTGLTFDAAEEITQNGTVLVLSAGNDTLSQYHRAIADIPGVIVVSSVNSNNEHGPTGHARNQWVDICAPGTRVPLTTINNSYTLGGGTSFAAPFVAGTAALMLSVNPCLTPATIETMIKQSADPIADAHLYHGMLGAGRVNAYKAVMRAGTRNIGYTTLTGNRTLRAGYVFSIGNASVGANSNITLRSRGGADIGPFDVPLGSSFQVVIDPNAVSDCN